MTNELSPWIVVALVFGVAVLVWSVFYARAWGGKRHNRSGR
jgi:hypothetical protein